MYFKNILTVSELEFLGFLVYLVEKIKGDLMFSFQWRTNAYILRT